MGKPSPRNSLTQVLWSLRYNRSLLAPSSFLPDARIPHCVLVLIGVVDYGRVFVVSQESLRSSVRAVDYVPSLLKPGNDNSPDVLSLADISDRLLQQVREELRAGHPTDAIQAHIYEAYGPQRSINNRKDQNSDISKYI